VQHTLHAHRENGIFLFLETGVESKTARLAARLAKLDIDRPLGPYWMALPTLENTLLAFEPISRTVPTTITRITASITAYSAIS
jgi:hypothetical protein